jgi:hypothetical protein
VRGGHGAGGRNPGRIIGTVLTAFVREHAGQRVRIIGEPIWAGRSEDEYPACAEHEALINVALAESPAYVLCPYDVRRLGREWLTDATRTHPTLAADGERGKTRPTPIPSRSPPGSTSRPSPPTRGRRARHRAHHRTQYRAAVRARLRAATGMSGRLHNLRTAVQELVVNTVAAGAPPAHGVDGR